MSITLEEISEIALELIRNNQEAFSASADNHESLLYSLSYNDGVFALLDAIIEKKGGTRI